MDDIRMQLKLIHAMYRMRMGHYIGIAACCVSFFKLGRIFADAIATGEVNS